MPSYNLEWTATANKDWITIVTKEGQSGTQVNGSGDMEVTVNTTIADYGSTDTAGTVTFTCIGFSDRTINVERCYPTECEYESTGVTTYIFQKIEVEACDTDVSFDVPSNTTYKSINGCDDKIVPGSESVYLTFGKNQTSSPRIIAESENKYKVTQKAGPCTSCGCSDITVSPETMSWAWNDTSESSSTITIGGECSGIISVTGVSTIGDFTATLYGNTIKVKPNGKNPEASGSKTGSVKVNFINNGTSYSCDKIRLSQSSQGCDCDSLSLNNTSVSIYAGRTGNVIVTPGCVDTSTISVESSDVAKATAVYNAETNIITITGVGKGNTTVTVKYKAGDNTNCTATIDVTVGCPPYKVCPQNGSGTGGEVTFTITEGECS